MTPRVFDVFERKAAMVREHSTPSLKTKLADLGALLSEDEAVARALRYLQELTQPIQYSGEPAADHEGETARLVARFGGVLVGRFGVRRFDYARLAGVAPRLSARRRSVEVEGTTPLLPAELLGVAADLGKNPSLLVEARDGCAAVTVDGAMIYVAVFDDAESEGGALVAWAGAAPGIGGYVHIGTALEQALKEQLVKSFQHEARWLRKLDRTQSLLYRDDLTGLFNTRYLEIALDAELRRADRFQSTFSLLFLDLDGFKGVNDGHGHLAGSALLRDVAGVIRDAVREIDIAIRYGGDEFLVLLLGATCAKAQLAAERLRKRLEERVFRLEDGATARLTASIGVASYPEHGRDRQTLLHAADAVMYDSKRAGKNRITVAKAATATIEVTPERTRRGG